MASIIGVIKERIEEEILTETQLDNVMAEYGFLPMDDDSDDNIIKYTNSRSRIWIDVCRDDDGNVMPEKVRQVTKEKDVETEVEPFHSFEDLKKVLDGFYNRGKYHHWFCAILQTLLGRRVGDIINLRWSEFYMKNGEFRDRLKTLVEEKTEKRVGIKLPEYAKTVITDYCLLKGIQPMERYDEKIFTTGKTAFRTALKSVVEEVGIKYNVSCHSFRKYFGNMSYKLHPNDPDRIKIIQYLFGHTSEEITRGYIATISETMGDYMEDFSSYIQLSFEGKTYEINNMPIISLQVSDLRNIIQKAYNLGIGNSLVQDVNTHMEIMNQLVSEMEKIRIQ